MFTKRGLVNLRALVGFEDFKALTVSDRFELSSSLWSSVLVDYFGTDSLRPAMIFTVFLGGSFAFPTTGPNGDESI